MDNDKIIYPTIMLSKTTQEKKQTAFQKRALGRDVDLRKRRKYRGPRKCIDV
jgi:hypothetical protein